MENSQGAPKRSRKSSLAPAADGRRKSVSFTGKVSVVYFQKDDDTSPMKPPPAAAAAAPPPVPMAAPPPRTAAVVPQAVKPVPQPAAAATVASSPVRRSPRRGVPSSPAGSEVSSAADLFFSPVESFNGTDSNRGSLGTPSLSGLLDADETAEQGVPALSQLVEHDAQEHDAPPPPAEVVEEDATMDMTVAVGGILKATAAASRPGVSAAQRRRSSVAPSLAATSGRHRA